MEHQVSHPRICFNVAHPLAVVFFCSSVCGERGGAPIDSNLREIHCLRCPVLSRFVFFPSLIDHPRHSPCLPAPRPFTCDRPAFGKRVLLEFEGGTYYPGTINTYGDSAKDISHSKGKWGVLFDDCTRDRFADGAADGTFLLSERPTKYE